MKTSPHRRLASWGRSSGATTGRTTALAWRSPRCRPTGGTCGPKQQGNGCRVASSPGTKPKTHPGKRERAVCPRAAGEFEGRRSIPRQAPCVIHGVGWLDHLTVVQASRTHPPKRLKSVLSSSPYPLFSRSSACNSTRIVISPSFARVRISSPPGRFFAFSPSLPPSRNSRRHRSRLWRRNPKLPAHLADVLAAKQPQHHLGLPLRTPPLRQAFRPPAALRRILLSRTPRHPVPPLCWTPERWLNYCPEKSGALYTPVVA